MPIYSKDVCYLWSLQRACNCNYTLNAALSCGSAHHSQHSGAVPLQSFTVTLGAEGLTGCRQ